MEKVFILNQNLNSLYYIREAGLPNDIINYFRADNNKIYIYNQIVGNCPENIDVDESRDYKLEYMFITNNVITVGKDNKEISEHELAYLIKIKRCIHHEQLGRDWAGTKKAIENVKKIMRDEGISYAGLTLDEIYGDNKASLYVTFEAEKIYKAKSVMKIKKPWGYYVFSDENKKEFKALEKYTDLKYWDDITDQIPRLDPRHYNYNSNISFLDLLFSANDERNYTDMLFAVLRWENTMNLFAQRFAKDAYVSSDYFEVRKNFRFKKGRPMRINLGAYNNDQRIVIENKIYSDDVATNNNNLALYSEWAEEKPNGLCFITCPDFGRNALEVELEDSLKGKYRYVTYGEISKFLNDLNKENHFEGFIFERYIPDIINSFNKFAYRSKTELLEQFFLDAILSTIAKQIEKGEI